MRVIPVAITRADLAVHVVNDMLCLLVDGGLATSSLRRCLGRVDLTDA